MVRHWSERVWIDVTRGGQVLAAQIVFSQFFWSHGPQSRCIWSKISQGNWFWRLKFVKSLRNPSKISKNWFPTPEKNYFFPNRFFDVLVVAKRRRRLEFWRRVALDFPDVPGRPSDDQNRIFSTNFRENFENFSKKNQKFSRSLVSL